MSYRAKVLISISATVSIAVWMVAWLISAQMTRTYEERDARRAAGVIAQFRREFARRGDDVGGRVSAIAGSDPVARIAAWVAQPSTELFDDIKAAEPLAQEHGLDLLAIYGPDGSILSSAHWPARFGYREEWITQNPNWNATPVFLKREDLTDGPVLALMAVRAVRAGDRRLYVAGGERLDASFLETLPVPEGMGVSVHRETDDLRAVPPDLAALVAQVRASGREQTRLVRTAAGVEVATAIPLAGRDNQALAVLLTTQSRAELLTLKRQVRVTALAVGGAAVILGLVLGFWAASRVTWPVRRLAGSVRQVAAGDWEARAAVTSRDEIGQLARDFNAMAEQLVEQRNRMLQAERVAAWREIARRLAHELKNPLFPLQITVENLRRARHAPPAEFDEIFDESTTTLLAELDNLKTIVGRFGDFARMPAPQFETVDLNELASESMRLFEARSQEPGRPAVRTRLDLAPDLPAVHADPEQLRRLLRNLALNALDAMPQGGDLTIRTAGRNGRVVLEVADTGGGLTPEERARLFTPYYTTKQHGTGLGLAIVQSVVSDHGGTISVDSEPGRGTTFRIELEGG